MSARRGAGGGVSSDVSFAVCTSLPNFSSLRSGSQVDAPWMRGWRRRAGRAPAEPEPQRLPGWTLVSQVQVGCQARGWGRRGAAGAWSRARGSGAPLLSRRAAAAAAGAGRRESGPAEPARSLTPRGAPGAAAAAAQAADNELASEPSPGRFGPGAPRLVLAVATAVPSEGGPFAAGPGRAASALSAGDTPGRAARPRRWGSHALSPVKRMQPEIGDWGPGDGMVALRTAGGLRGAHAAGHARAGGPEEPSRSQRPRASRLGKVQAEDGRTDSPMLWLCERA